MTTAAPNLIKTYDFGDKWLKQVNSFYSMHLVELDSHVVKKMFTRSYMKTNRDLYFLMTFATHLVGEKGDVKKMLEVLRKSAAKANKTLDGKIAQLDTLLRNNGADIVIPATQTLQAQTPVLTPLSKDVIELFKKADKAFGLSSLCWFEGLADDAQKRKLEEEVRDALSVCLMTIRTVMGTAMNAMRKKEAEGTLPAEASEELQEAREHIESTSDVEDAAAQVDNAAVAEANAIMAQSEEQPA